MGLSGRVTAAGEAARLMMGNHRPPSPGGSYLSMNCCAKCGVKSPIIKREPGVTYRGRPIHLSEGGHSPKATRSGGRPPPLASHPHRAGCKSERGPGPARRPGAGPAGRQGRENLFSLLVSSAEVITTTAGEFARSGDKGLNDSSETRQSRQMLPESKLHLHVN